MKALCKTPTKSDSGIFGVRAQIPLDLRPALRVLRFATQRNCDLTPKTIRPNAKN